MIPAQMTSVAVLWAALKTDVGIQEWSSFWKTESWNKGFPTANGQLVQQGRIEWAGREAHGKKHQLFILFSAFPTSLWRIELQVGQKPTWNSSCVTLCFCLEGNQQAAQCCLGNIQHSSTSTNVLLSVAKSTWKAVPANPPISILFTNYREYTHLMKNTNDKLAYLIPTWILKWNFNIFYNFI